MQLREIELSLNHTVPATVQDFLTEADRRCDQFFDTGANQTIPRFLPANYHLIYKALSELKEGFPILGNRFCEWGSGLGTASCLAAILGYESCGVEIEVELVERSRKFAHDQNLTVTFLHESLLPEGYDFLKTQGGMELLTPPRANQSSAFYPGVDWSLDEIDLFYAYPWPEEQEATLALFEAVACDGAYLLCYYGDDEICAYRKHLS
ncbi:hypothetical protein [Pelagicoccus mobilis]|uniref:Uncharacterized protein n=1 Tax=Pelagicoccus mobilis TaxID=415221 RepID=A0A934RVD3_9BACT|nr:hypothetical protein [Pelagicoccus mobilis]MBK1877517.1 hypothetical protein [Pelagicoccus mobilis]